MASSIGSFNPCGRSGRIAGGPRNTYSCSVGEWLLQVILNILFQPMPPPVFMPLLLVMLTLPLVLLDMLINLLLLKQLVLKLLLLVLPMLL